MCYFGWWFYVFSIAVKINHKFSDLSNVCFSFILSWFLWVSSLHGLAHLVSLVKILHDWDEEMAGLCSFLEALGRLSKPIQVVDRGSVPCGPRTAFRFEGFLLTISQRQPLVPRNLSATLVCGPYISGPAMRCQILLTLGIFLTFPSTVSLMLPRESSLLLNAFVVRLDPPNNWG